MLFSNKTKLFTIVTKRYISKESGWLLSRLGPDRNVKGYFIDPEVDFEPLFSNTQLLAENLKSRNYPISLEQLNTLKLGYQNWKAKYIEFTEIDSSIKQLDGSESNPKLLEKRFSIRNELSELHPIIHQCLSLPNALCQEDYSIVLPHTKSSISKNYQFAFLPKFDEILNRLHDSSMLSTTSNPHTSFLSGDLVLLQYALLDYFEEQVQVQMACNSITLPHLLRSVLEEGCHQYPINESIQVESSSVPDQNVPPMKLLGLTLPSFMAIFARHKMSGKSLPMSLYSIGTHYFRNTKNVFSQTPRLSILSLAKTEEESINQLQNLLHNFLRILRSISSHFVCLKSDVKDLYGSECARYEFSDSMGQFPKVCSISQYADFVSKRLRLYTDDSVPLHLNLVELDINLCLLYVLAEHANIDQNCILLDDSHVLAPYFNSFKV